MDERNDKPDDGWTAEDQRRVERLQHIGDLKFAAQVAQDMKQAGFNEEAIRAELDAWFPEVSGAFRGLSLATEEALKSAHEKVAKSQSFDLDTEEGRFELAKYAARDLATSPDLAFVEFVDRHPDTMPWIRCAPKAWQVEKVQREPVEKSWHELSVRERCERKFEAMTKERQRGTQLTYEQAYCEIFKREDAQRLYELYGDEDSNLDFDAFVRKKNRQGNIDASYIAKKMVAGE